MLWISSLLTMAWVRSENQLTCIALDRKGYLSHEMNVELFLLPLNRYTSSYKVYHE